MDKHVTFPGSLRCDCRYGYQVQRLQIRSCFKSRRSGQLSTMSTNASNAFATLVRMSNQRLSLEMFANENRDQSQKYISTRIQYNPFPPVVEGLDSSHVYLSRTVCPKKIRENWAP